MTDPEWLRERPEIVTACDEGMGEFAEEHGGTDECTDFNMTAAGLARALPYLRAAIREDVVRELAGDARDVATEIGHSTAVQTCCNNPTRGKNGEAECCGAPDVQFIFTADTEDRIVAALAAAHLAGRAAGREEAAKVADEFTATHGYGFNIATAIRSLP